MIKCVFSKLYNLIQWTKKWHFFHILLILSPFIFICTYFSIFYIAHLIKGYNHFEILLGSWNIFFIIYTLLLLIALCAELLFLFIQRFDYKKKVLLLLLFIIVYNIPAIYAEYTPIPNNLKSSYKKEIEQVINKEVPKSKLAIKNIEFEIKKEKNPYNRQTIIDYGITSILFDFYTQLINVTEKYSNIKQSIPPTDWYIELKESITPYFIDNNINSKRIDALIDYANRKQKEINKRFTNY